MVRLPCAPIAADAIPRAGGVSHAIAEYWRRSSAVRTWASPPARRYTSVVHGRGRRGWSMAWSTTAQRREVDRWTSTAQEPTAPIVPTLGSLSTVSPPVVPNLCPPCSIPGGEVLRRGPPIGVEADFGLSRRRRPTWPARCFGDRVS